MWGKITHTFIIRKTFVYYLSFSRVKHKPRTGFTGNRRHRRGSLASSPLTSVHATCKTGKGDMPSCDRPPKERQGRVRREIHEAEKEEEASVKGMHPRTKDNAHKSLEGMSAKAGTRRFNAKTTATRAGRQADEKAANRTMARDCFQTSSQGRWIGE